MLRRLALCALLAVAAGTCATQAQASQTNWGYNTIAASGCETFSTPTYSWVSMHTRMWQYVCWGNGRILSKSQPQRECWVDWHGRVIGIKCTEANAYTYVSNYNGGVPVSQYARTDFTFNQCLAVACSGQWRPSLSIRVRAADRIVTSTAWSR